MASSGNFCTWNPNDCVSSLKFNTGNLSTDQDNNDWRGMFGTHPFTSGKWYWEAYQNSNNSNNGFPVAIQRASDGLNYLMWSGSNAYLGRAVGTYGYSYAIYTNAPTYSEKRHNNSSTNTNLSAGTTGDIYQLAVDLDAGKIWFGKNNTWADSGDPANGSNEAFSSIPAGTYVPASVTWNSSGSDNFVSNWGQDDTFGGAITAAGNADGNGHGVFKYSPPTGFLALCSANLSVSDDIDPAQTDDDYPAKNFNVVPYTGNQTDGRAVTGVGFAPDLVWIKQRVSFSNPNILTDTVRGATKRIESNVAIAEATDSDGLQSFTSDGFTLGTNDKYNWTSSHTYVAWCWKAGGAPTATNSAGAGATPTSGSVKIDGSNLGSALAGSIPATKLSANTKGGFSIITYTGTGSNATIAHGLTAKPDLIFTKRLNSEQTWGVYHTSLGATKYLALNSTAAAGTDSAFWNDTEPTTSVISLGTEGRVNGNSQNYVAYAWHNVDGYSKFGSYVGNGNADGVFIYTGFRPKMIFLRRTGGTDDFFVMDTARDTFNVAGDYLRWNTNDAEADSSLVDFLSNGFKLRSSSASLNPSGSTIVYGAWGDVPFKYNNTF